MVQKQPGSETQRRAAAAAALSEIQPGMRLGLGTGRTAGAFVDLLGEKVQSGLSVVGVPTSEVTAQAARALGIPLTTLDETPELDLTVDGADEVDPAFQLIKGGGGALLREKIVASASKRMIVVVDDVKCVDTLGRFPLPIEVVPFGLGATRLEIERAAKALGLTGHYVLRQDKGQTFLTDGGHHIIDASFGRIPDPVALAQALSAIPGVVEHGLFIGLASRVIVGREGGITELEATEPKS